jgi:hypothetical protein
MNENDSQPPRPAASDATAMIRQTDVQHAAGPQRVPAESLERATAIDPGSIVARFNLAKTRLGHPRSVEELEAALGLARELLGVYPHSLGGHMLAAKACHGLELNAEYGRHLDAVVALTSEEDGNHLIARDSRATLRLQQGDFGAWAEFAHSQGRLPKRAPLIRPLGPLWDGGPIAGRTVLANALADGFGDAFQFIRYLPKLKATGAHVRLLCYASQVRLIAQGAGGLGLDGIIPFSTAGIARKLLTHDVQVPLMSLPAIVGTTLETIPADTPYLAADAGTLARWRPAIEAIPGFRVGVVWQGDPRHTKDRHRSFRLAEFAALAAVRDVSLVSLQRGYGTEQRPGVGFSVVDLGPPYNTGDWLDTAAVISQLDLVISPDTAAAHLAGALGKPVWLALSRPAEWRWLRDRDDSPWYPTMRLFRQEKFGEWRSVFERMADALGEQTTGGATRARR